MGAQNGPTVFLQYTLLSITLAFAGKTIVSAPLPAGQSA
jgi:hypothetical protein